MNRKHHRLVLASLLLAAVPALGQTIGSLSHEVLPRSGRLVITGAGFGEGAGAGRVLIGGEPAIVTRWHDQFIYAYVPEAAPRPSRSRRPAAGATP